MTANTSSTTPGSMVSYTITVTNSGQVAYTGATFTDALSGVLDDATYNSDAAATAGSVTFQPEPDLDREPGCGSVRDDHVLGDGEQPRHREQGPGHHDHLGHGGQQLRQRQHRHPVCQHASRCWCRA